MASHHKVRFNYQTVTFSPDGEHGHALPCRKTNMMLTPAVLSHFQAHDIVTKRFAESA